MIKKYLYWVIPTVILLIMGIILPNFAKGAGTIGNILGIILYLLLPIFLREWHNIIKQIEGGDKD